MMMVLGSAGILGISCVVGASVMHFRLPPSHFLDEAFRGGSAWAEKKAESFRPADPPASRKVAPFVDQPKKTFDGYTLYTIGSERRVMLIDMDGKVVHEWKKSFREIWPNPVHIKEPVRDDQVYFSSCRLYPNGDLLVALQAKGDTPYGYGLAKLDKDSNVLWRFADHVHHEIDVGDDGNIHVLTQEIVTELPEGMEWVPTPCLIDSVVKLSAGGEELKRVPVLEAFRNSEYRLLLDQIRNQHEPAQGVSLRTANGTNLNRKGDILHPNSVHALSQRLKPAFPSFQLGQVLISVRELGALAVLDMDKGVVVWATVGPWQGQHNAQFLDNGHLLLFDNHGIARNSRLIEYDLQTQSFPWWFPKAQANFFSEIRGVAQRLPNGNTFFIESERGDMREISPGGELVWHVQCTPFIPTGRRYGPQEVRFLGENVRPRRGS
jgi:hypothetical protein